MSERNFCTYSYESKICEGDSGGPAVKMFNDEYHLYGIASHSKTCGAHNEPSIFVSVDKFYDWIQNKMNEI